MGDSNLCLSFVFVLALQPGLRKILTFAPADTQICVDVPIQDDRIALEPPEILTFTITVINPVPGIEIDPFNTIIVTIVDEDGELRTLGIEMPIHVVLLGDCLC